MDIIFSIQIPGWFFQPFDHAKSRSCPTTPRYDLKSSWNSPGDEDQHILDM